MSSLTEVYEGRVRWVASTRRLHLGVGLFLVGTAMVVAGIVVATTNLLTAMGAGLFEARELGGVLAGLGVPAALLGVFAVLPTGRRLRASAIIGASVSVLGVTVFVHAYPYQWLNSGDATLALLTTGIYFFGAITTFLSLFVAVATFKTRSDPGGTAKMEVTKEGKVRIVQEDDSLPMGGIGLFGNDFDPKTEPDPTPTSPTPNAPTVSDGGAAKADDSGTGGEPVETVSTRGQPDEYCGNCDHFKYVRTDGRMVPYCGLQAELMDDMDACDEWAPNS
ncbi:hypothetical protein VB773_17665 [Haloarculaceae archaeon H-GB2-1]|nr:hypothetical protein [Haloarculaceae archaeon H-GB1-1]MEA5387725.1 hypothetical protein [Haloarculaceae archaeon H-GB11]MEA5409215.1 hypothetical protein [Haloarculaceae archaeon H-GB2-1]